jgi:undecaprenyl-diphosphatase
MHLLDVAVTQWMNGFAGRSAALDFLMISISTVGVPILVLAVIVQWWFPRPDPSNRHVLSFLLGLALNQLILLLVHRARPYDSGITHLLIGPSADYSFPSDHATATFAIAATFLLHGKRGCGIAFSIAALLMIVSRVYVGTHYASDVLGGAVTGIIAAIFVRLVYREGTRADRFVTGIL